MENSSKESEGTRAFFSLSIRFFFSFLFHVNRVSSRKIIGTQLISTDREPVWHWQLVKLEFESFYLDDIFVRQALVWLIVFRVFEQHFVHVGARILVQFIAAGEYDECNFAIAQHRQFVRLFHDAEFALVESHLRNGCETERKKDLNC